MDEKDIERHLAALEAITASLKVIEDAVANTLRDATEHGV